MYVLMYIPYLSTQMFKYSYVAMQLCICRHYLVILNCVFLFDLIYMTCVITISKLIEFVMQVITLVATCLCKHKQLFAWNSTSYINIILSLYQLKINVSKLLLYVISFCGACQTSAYSCVCYLCYFSYGIRPQKVNGE